LAISDDYLKYPQRRYGMDHGRYGWSILPKRKPVEWPGKARVALWITVALEWFPLDQQGKPFKPLGSLQTAYPDLRHYTLRDYGNRVGVFRVMKALEKHGIRASAAVNAAVAVRYPSLIETIRQKRWEIVGHGLDMDHLHYEGMSGEKDLVSKAVSILGKPRGWLSPARSESAQTPDLLAEAGVEYLCDWVNDDMPYEFKAGDRTLHAMPLSGDIDDAALLLGMHHDEDEVLAQLTDQFDVLYEEAAKHGGRIMSVMLHPWAIGQPYRIGTLERALAHFMRHPGVWPATGSEILDAWRKQQ
jgi:peptidoglycan/xylan/chitin deacetylase (PgdA/CDA1 family)